MKVLLILKEVDTNKILFVGELNLTQAQQDVIGAFVSPTVACSFSEIA